MCEDGNEIELFWPTEIEEVSVAGEKIDVGEFLRELGVPYNKLYGSHFIDNRDLRLMKEIAKEIEGCTITEERDTSNLTTYREFSQDRVDPEVWEMLRRFVKGVLR